MNTLDSLFVFFICILVILGVVFVSSIVNPSFTSASVVDLLVNNGINIAIALFISLCAVQSYEKKRHRVVFLLDLIEKTDNLCKELRNMILSHHSQGETKEEERLIDAYVTNYKILLEYVSAINKKLKKCTRNKTARQTAASMLEQAKRSFDPIALDSQDDAKVSMETVYKKILPSVYSIQASLSALLTYIQ